MNTERNYQTKAINQKVKIIQVYLDKFAKEYVICHGNTPI